MAVMRLFAAAREAAGTGRDTIDAATVDEALAIARRRYGDGFAAVLAGCKVWVNGEPVEPGTAIGPDDEVAVLPPVSGGAGPGRAGPRESRFDLAWRGQNASRTGGGAGDGGGERR
jgi:sulfur-carrier protein